MQKLNMSSYGVKELDANEMKNIEGGIVMTALVNATLGLGLLASILINRTVGAAGDASCILAEFFG